MQPVTLPMQWLIKVGIGAFVGLLAGEVYKRCTTPEQKRRWEGFVRTHHGEAGVAGVALGAATRSPALLGIGAGLALHDWKDAAKWFKR